MQILFSIYVFKYYFNLCTLVLILYFLKFLVEQPREIYLLFIDV